MNQKPIFEAVKDMTLEQKIQFLLIGHDRSTGDKWQRGLSSHHTITDTGYRIAEFHHADDASFVDAAHALIPELMAQLTALLTANAMRALTDKKNRELQTEVFDLTHEVNQLRAFAQAIMESWPIGDVDGGHLQDMAVKHGLLVKTTQNKPCCEEGCTCAEYLAPDEFPTECYRHTNLLKGN